MVFGVRCSNTSSLIAPEALNTHSIVVAFYTNHVFWGYRFLERQEDERRCDSPNSYYPTDSHVDNENRFEIERGLLSLHREASLPTLMQCRAR